MTNEFERDIEMARRIAREIDARGGRTFYVGGFVRDALTGRENKDVDIEIHGVSPAGVQEALDSLGTRLNIGESFGIFGLKGYSVDIAMPRQEKLRGVGHRDFDVSVDPFIGTFKAAERRDFTINALMQDVLTGEIIDHFGGREHLKKGLRSLPRGSALRWRRRRSRCAAGWICPPFRRSASTAKCARRSSRRKGPRFSLRPSER